MLSGEKISQTDLLSIPAFISFNCVKLVYLYGHMDKWFSYWFYHMKQKWLGYWFGYGRIKQKCKRFQVLLQPIKHAINGAKFEFKAQICNNNYFRDFTDNSMLLAHLEKELLPICNACRSYKFEIRFLSDYSSATNVIATILQFGPIDRCSKVLFDLYSHHFQTEMPVMSIVNWLNHSRFDCD